MREPKRLARYTIIAVSLLVVVVLGSALITLLQIAGDPMVNSGRAFILAALREGEEASQCLTEELKTDVRIRCPGGQVTDCLAPLVDDTWGELENVISVYGTGDQTLLFHMFWSNLPSQHVAVVLQMEEVDARWLVAGWRGFTVLDSPDEELQLLRGQRHDNEFPPVAG